MSDAVHSKYLKTITDCYNKAWIETMEGRAELERAGIYSAGKVEAIDRATMYLALGFFLEECAATEIFSAFSPSEAAKFFALMKEAVVKFRKV